MDTNSDDSSCLSDDSDVAFALMDFTGVDFGDGEEEKSTAAEEVIENVATEADAKEKVEATEIQLPVALKKSSPRSNSTTDTNKALMEGAATLKGGERGESTKNYTTNLSSGPANLVFDRITVSKVDLDDEGRYAIAEESGILFKDCYIGDVKNIDDQDTRSTDSDVLRRIIESSKLLSEGDYLGIISGSTATNIFQHDTVDPDKPISVANRVRHCVLEYCTSVAKCVEVELMAVACLNIFLQCNYTGPSLHHGGVSRRGKVEETYDVLKSVNPHPMFASQLNVSTDINEVQNEPEEDDKQKEPPIDASFHNSVLGELSVDGEWPCPVCKLPYFLLLARSILSTLADPNRPVWTEIIAEKTEGETQNKVVIRKSSSGNHYEIPPEDFAACAQNLVCAPIWCARAIVAHSRLLQGDESSMRLWKEVSSMFDVCVSKYCDFDLEESNAEQRALASKVLLEYGLAEHHFKRNKMGKPLFERALKYSDLDVEVTGAEGKRTKYQQKATAQMLVRAKPKTQGMEGRNSVNKDKVGEQEIKFEDDTILLDKVKYEEESDNVHFELSILQQTVLLALCLDVKNENPMDGLTGEQMGGYLERVLQQHDDWMVYATGLLERAWLESEKNHTRERALFQIQALADQHTNRLTITQSTFQAAVEDSAPPQERLRNIHYIVYPPRWEALRDLATRYTSIGIVTSAAEIFEEIELWDEVVECYRRAEKDTKAEEVVRRRLAEVETPRMWAALGDITGDKTYYEKALEISNGRYCSAYVALGQYYSEKGDIEKAVENLKVAVEIKPLSPSTWFRLGALSMRLEDWKTALRAFTEVVEQEPEEGDAWANVAAIHMHNKNPSEAYPALNESLKLNRNNWRVWVSKLYTCMDLQKYDEAIQACIFLIDMRGKKNESEGIPNIEEKVVRALVGASISSYRTASESDDSATMDSAKRTLARVRELLSVLQRSSKEPWLFEASAFLNESIGRGEQAVDDLMKEYRSLVSYKGWEADKSMLPRVCRVVSQIADFHLHDGNIDALKKFKFLVNGVIKKVKGAYFDPSKLPTTILEELEDIMERLGAELKSS